MKPTIYTSKNEIIIVGYYFTKFHTYNLQLTNHTQSLCSK